MKFAALLLMVVFGMAFAKLYTAPVLPCLGKITADYAVYEDQRCAGKSRERANYDY